MSYLKLNYHKKESNNNIGKRFSVKILALFLFLLSPLLQKKIEKEISNPTLPPFVINFLNDPIIMFLFTYGLSLLLLFLLDLDVREENKVNILGIVSGFTLIILSLFDYFSVVSMVVGYFLLFVSII